MQRANSQLRRALCLWTLTALLIGVGAVRAQTTAFTYQGKLTDGGSPADGTYDLQFQLFDAVAAGNQIGSTLAQLSVPVTNGAFTAQLDFGAAAFPGDDRFLEIGVRPGGSAAAYTVLSPRTQITSTPYAVRAASAASVDGLSGGMLSANSVDIGTDTPHSLPLHVNGTSWFQGDTTPLPATVGTGVAVGYSSSLDAGYVFAYDYSAGTPKNLLLNSPGGNVGIGGNVSIDGNVGIGTSTPESMLHISGVAGGGSPFQGLTIDQTIGIVPDLTGNLLLLRSINQSRFPFVTSTYLPVNSLGRVGIGTAVPGHRLTVSGGPTWTSAGWSGAVELDNAAAIGWRANTAGNRFGIGHTNGGLYFFHTASDPGTTGSGANYDLIIKDNGHVSVNVLEIQGGADLSETFDVGSPGCKLGAELAELQPGLLVSIDPQHPGKLMVSDRAYDPRVAGVISGAGGVAPGMIMGQAGSLASGQQAVALNGRVYCWADASDAPIRPGDLLTTSKIPGHAMRVTDHTKGQGAIIGKAMTGLERGKGLVLVLVTLQ
jgi:hypothetical protein